MAKDGEGVKKRILIAGAGAALTYKERHPKANDSEVMSHVEKDAKRLIREIEEDQ